eukprot:2185741-Rhodomonas_salina.1
MRLLKTDSMPCLWVSVDGAPSRNSRAKHTLSLSFHLSPSLGPAFTESSGSELSVFLVLPRSTPQLPCNFTTGSLNASHAAPRQYEHGGFLTQTNPNVSFAAWHHASRLRAHCPSHKSAMKHNRPTGLHTRRHDAIVQAGISQTLKIRQPGEQEEGGEVRTLHPL